MTENSSYQLPAETKIGHVHLKVSDLEQSINFYTNILGFTLVSRFGGQAAFVSAGGYHHHIGLNTWHSKNGKKAPTSSPGLYHVAILYPTRKDLAKALQQLIDNKYAITGVADHGVSEAIYLNDPDGNGLELYWDKPKEQWPYNKNGELEMYTAHLDISGLLAELHEAY